MHKLTVGYVHFHLYICKFAYAHLFIYMHEGTYIHFLHSYYSNLEHSKCNGNFPRDYESNRNVKG